MLMYKIYISFCNLFQYSNLLLFQLNIEFLDNRKVLKEWNTEKKIPRHTHKVNFSKKKNGFENGFKLNEMCG